MEFSDKRSNQYIEIVCVMIYLYEENNFQARSSQKRCDYKYKKLLINGIDVNIPCGLSRDLCAALKYAESKQQGAYRYGNIFKSGK